MSEPTPRSRAPPEVESPLRPLRDRPFDPFEKVLWDLWEPLRKSSETFWFWEPLRKSSETFWRPFGQEVESPLRPFDVLMFEKVLWDLLKTFWTLRLFDYFLTIRGRKSSETFWLWDLLMFEKVLWDLLKTLWRPFEWRPCEDLLNEWPEWGSAHDHYDHWLISVAKRFNLVIAFNSCGQWSCIKRSIICSSVNSRL